MAESAVSFLVNQIATLLQEERQLLEGLDENVLHIRVQLELMQAFLGVADAEEDGNPQLKAWVKKVREVVYDPEDVILSSTLRETAITTQTRMTESAVSFLLNQIAILFQEKRQLLGGLDESILHIKDQLEFMKAFLGVADAEEDGDPQLKTWVKKVREVTYDSEDVIETFMLQFAHLRAEDGFCGCVQKICIPIKNLRARHNIALDLANIKLRLQNISEGHQMFQSKYSAQLRSNSTRQLFDGRNDALLVDEAKLVGIDRPKELLIKELLDGETRLKAVSVVGLGGLGKSTLVKRIYEDEQVKGKFQCYAWLTVSRSFDIMELLKDLIRQLHHEIKEPVPQQLELFKEVELKESVKNFLSERRYIIVFDDVWSTGSWDSLKHALPDNNMSSRVVLTTRTLDVANLASRSAYPGHVHEMKALSYDDSWTLLCNKTFGDEIFPQHLKDYADDMLKKCEGLPLAIDAVGGLLSMKDKNSIEEWNKVCRYLNTKLDGDGKLERIKQVLLLSYYDLPYYLKTCLLYLSIFPEDHMIENMRLIRLWVAEGLVQGEGRMTKEDVALDYLKELVNRSLIQVAETYPDGRVRLCRIHDIVHEILVRKSIEQNVVIGIDSRFPDKVRRFAIRTSLDSSLIDVNRLKYLRSLTLSASEDSRFESFLSKLLSGSQKLLKVLDLRDASLEKIPNDVFKLYHLTYLSLRGTEVKAIPKSIGQLQCLETLDLKHTEIIALPIEILKLKRLRHLLVYKYKYKYNNGSLFDSLQSFKAPYRIGCLSSLQKLCYIEADQMGDTTIVREIGRLTQLRKLGIAKLRREDGKDLCSSLDKLTELRSLIVYSSNREDDIIDLQYPLYFKFLRTICLVGRLEKVPQWIPSLHSLTDVDLRSNKLRNNPLESLQDLPSLARLLLDETFEGEKLEFKAGKFQHLKILTILRFSRLRKIRVEKCSMPNLNQLYLARCKLVELPIDFEHLNKLRHFQINDMSKNFVEALENQKRSEGSNWKLAHVTNVVVFAADGNPRWRYL